LTLDLAFNISGQRENSPYSLSEPNESGIVNRQRGVKKLKYVLKFYTGGPHHVISRMCNDDLALCQWANDVLERNISETVRDRYLGPKNHQ